MPASGSGRTLGTARAALRVLRLLWQHPEGVRVGDVSALTGKSTWTARYLLNSLCQEGFAERIAGTGVYRPTRSPSALGPPAPTVQGHERTGPIRISAPRHGVDLDGLRDAMRELALRTRERVYLAVVEDDRMSIAEVVGRQGLPLLRGVDPALRGQAHALAIGKAMLAYGEPALRSRYLDGRPLERFTTATITEEHALARELEMVRRSGVAFDREEFREGFCCLAVPILQEGELVGSMGVAVPAPRFEREREELRSILERVGRWVSTVDGVGGVGPRASRIWNGTVGMRTCP